jgi:hypothetical protein
MRAADERKLESRRGAARDIEHAGLGEILNCLDATEGGE